MIQDFFYRTGKMALGSRLRLLTDHITQEAAKIYEPYHVKLEPKWFPVFFSLMGGKKMSVTEIAQEIGHTHPSVIKILKEMEHEGLVVMERDEQDRRRTLVRLSDPARQYEPALEVQCRDVGAAIQRMCDESNCDIWKALEVWEQLLDKQSLFSRVMDEKQRREADEVQIVSYDDSRHREGFKRVNELWINDLFKMEAEDHYELDHPMENIILPGGYIYIAELKGQVVGAFAMMKCKKPEYDWELVKYAVDPVARGKGIGKRLMKAVLDKARQLGEYRIFLETNHKCEAAVHLYEKFGFKHLPVTGSEYDRCDVQMEFILKPQEEDDKQ